MIISIHIGKAFDNTQQLFVIKIKTESGHRRNIPQHNKGHI